MRIFEYILKFGFMYGLSIGLLLVLAPLMWKSAEEADSEKAPNTQLQQLKLFVENPQSYGEERYINLLLKDEQGNQYQTIFFVPEGGHRKLLQFLEKHELVKLEQELSTQLPLTIHAQDKQALLSAVYLEIKDNQIIQFQIGGEMVIGNAGFGRQIFLYLLSIMFGIVGILALALSTYALAGNLKQYNQTGRLPELPNSVQSKWEGLKYLFRGFRY